VALGSHLFFADSVRAPGKKLDRLATASGEIGAFYDPNRVNRCCREHKRGKVN
jgi:hypothetical protein